MMAFSFCRHLVTQHCNFTPSVVVTPALFVSPWPSLGANWLILPVEALYQLSAAPLRCHSSALRAVRPFERSHSLLCHAPESLAQNPPFRTVKFVENNLIPFDDDVHTYSFILTA